MKYKFGVYGGKHFGGKYAMVNKYFIKKKNAKEFIDKYKKKYPRRKLTMSEF